MQVGFSKIVQLDRGGKERVRLPHPRGRFGTPEPLLSTDGGDEESKGSFKEKQTRCVRSRRSSSSTLTELPPLEYIPKHEKYLWQETQGDVILDEKKARIPPRRPGSLRSPKSRSSKLSSIKRSLAEAEAQSRSVPTSRPSAIIRRYHLPTRRASKLSGSVFSLPFEADGINSCPEAYFSNASWDLNHNSPLLGSSSTSIVPRTLNISKSTVRSISPKERTRIRIRWGTSLSSSQANLRPLSESRAPIEATVASRVNPRNVSHGQAGSPRSALLSQGLLQQESFELVRVIGTGAFAKVWLAKAKGRPGRYVAIKQISMAVRTNTEQDEDELKSKVLTRSEKKMTSDSGLEKEVGLLQRLSHPNIVRYIGLYITEEWSAGKIYNIVIEYVPDGDLDSYLCKNGALPELTAASLTSQLAAGLYYLHQHKVIHRDLKPANLLLGREKKKRQRRAEGASEAGEEDCSSGRIIVKISDFGVSADVRGEELAKRSCVGTPWYLAPEVARAQPYSYSADIFSLGSVIYSMVTGKKPYHKLAPIPALFKIAREGAPKVDAKGLGVSAECLDLLEICWRKEPKARLQAKEVLHHEWLASILGLATQAPTRV